MITRVLLAFSGEIQQAPTLCRLDEVVAETLPLVSRVLTRHGGRIEVESAEAIVAELRRILPARSQGEWMIGANVNGRYLGKYDTRRMPWGQRPCRANSFAKSS